MAETSIEWTVTPRPDGTLAPGYTFNPWIGCTRKSEGCRFCYAEQLMDHRYGRVKWGPTGTRERTSEGNWKKPRKWDREAAADGVRRKVFCASLADVFEDRPELNAWRRDLARLIRETPNLDWLLLTKRPENAKQMIYEMWFPDAEWPKNYWLGTSVEDQARADERIPHLLATPAAVRFLSVEPLLAPVRLPFFEPTTERERLAVVAAAEAFGGIPEDSLNAQLSRYYTAAERGIHWVIVGGESGHGARPCEPEWIRSIRDQCQSAGVPVFVKQMGSHWASAAQAAVVAEWESRRDSDAPEWAGPRPEIDRKGGDWSEWPADLRVREFPVIAEDDGDSCPDLFSHVHG